MKIAHILYNFILALWVGGIFIFSFLITPILFQSFGRDTAGEIVGKLFPYYFAYNLVLSVLALVVFLLFSGIQGRFQNKIVMVLLIAALLINLFVTFKLYPDIKGLKQQIATFGTQSDESPIRNKFRKLHTVSAIFNILLLIDGSVLLILFNNTKK